MKCLIKNAKDKYRVRRKDIKSLKAIKLCSVDDKSSPKKLLVRIPEEALK